jgi:hypothetical protein
MRIYGRIFGKILKDLDLTYQDISGPQYFILKLVFFKLKELYFSV